MMKIKNTSDQNIEGFKVENEKCDFPAGEINTVPDELGKAALKQYGASLEEVKEKKETAKEKKEREKVEKAAAKEVAKATAKAEKEAKKTK